MPVYKSVITTTTITTTTTFFFSFKFNSLVLMLRHRNPLANGRDGFGARGSNAVEQHVAELLGREQGGVGGDDCD